MTTHRQVKIIGAETVTVPYDRFMESAAQLMGAANARNFEQALASDRFVEYEMFGQPIRAEMVPVTVYDVYHVRSHATFMGPKEDERQFVEQDILLSELLTGEYREEYLNMEYDDSHVVSARIRDIVDLKPGQHYNLGNRYHILCKEI